jgi:carbamoyl-phosphate synthase large subunit
MNVQYAILNDDIYVLEVNPRASRTVPFVSKAIQKPIASLASKVMAGKTLRELGIKQWVPPHFFSVKQPVFPFNKFPNVDPILGPEMKSTGESMGMHKQFGLAYAKAQMGGFNTIPRSGRVFVSVCNSDKPKIITMVRQLKILKFSICGTSGTADYLNSLGIETESILKIHQGSPNVLDEMKTHKIDMVFNTQAGDKTGRDALSIRRLSVVTNTPYFTTISAMRAVVSALSQSTDDWNDPLSLQERANQL